MIFTKLRRLKPTAKDMHLSLEHYDVILCRPL
jgi:hypothetical protein